MRKHFAILSIFLFGASVVVRAEDQGPVEKTGKTVEKAATKTGQTVEHAASATGQTVKHGTQATERTVGKGLKKREIRSKRPATPPPVRPTTIMPNRMAARRKRVRLLRPNRKAHRWRHLLQLLSSRHRPRAASTPEPLSTPVPTPTPSQ